MREPTLADLLKAAEEAKPRITAAEFFAPVGAADLLRAEPPPWLVRNVLVAGQPGVIGGGMKTLKTSVALDLLVSVASGTPFLGRFAVPTAKAGLMLSGESGPWALGNLLGRICEARGIDAPGELPLSISTRLPSLSNPEQLDLLGELISQTGAALTIVDPLYLCLLGGLTDGSAASNFYIVGPLLANIARVAAEAGTTLVLLHHANRAGSLKNEPLSLTDLSFAGVGEHARQWCLLSRREAHDPAQPHKLWLSVGGSAGFSGLHCLDIDEGGREGELGSRVWQVEVAAPGETRKQVAEDRQAKAAARAAEKCQADERLFLAAMDRLDPQWQGVSLRSVRIDLGFGADKTDATAARLRRLGLVEVYESRTSAGKGASQGCRSVRRAREGGPE